MKYKLRPENKFHLKSEFDHVRANGIKQVCYCMVLVTAIAPDQILRCGVICSRKYSNRAVDRNRARRLLWESFRKLKPEISPCHITLIARRGIAGMKQQDVQTQMRFLLKEGGLLVRNNPCT